MVVFVIIMGLITTGKARGQISTPPEAINVRLFSPFPLHPRTLAVPERARFLPQDIPRQNSVQHSSTDRLKPIRNGGDLNLRPPTLESRPDRRLFIPERSPDRPSRPDIVKVDPGRFIVEIDTAVKYRDMDPNKPNNEENRSSFDKQNSPSTTKPVNNTNKPENPVLESVGHNESTVDIRVNGSQENNGTTIKPSPAVDKAMDVSFESRAAFVGDSCATGYVRVDGKCVKFEEDVKKNATGMM